MALFNGIKKKHPLLYFITNRIITMLFLLFFLGFALFALMELAPGDIVDSMISLQLSSELQEVDSVNIDNEELREELGLNKPFYIQYGKWLKRVFVDHDLGKSLISKAPITFLIKSRILNSLVLNIISLIFITLVSFILGLYFSSKSGTKLDTAVCCFALFFNAFPPLLLLLLFQLFASVTGLFPVTAYPSFSFTSSPIKFIFSYSHHIFLPLLAAFLGGVGGTIRIVRSTILDQMGLPYILALRARGISEKRILINHAFKNTLNPYITSSASLLASLFSGSMILEVIFAYPGLGRLMYDAVIQQDINLVLANSMFISFLVLLGMVITDILLAIVDPRIRYGSKEER